MMNDGASYEFLFTDGITALIPFYLHKEFSIILICARSSYSFLSTQKIFNNFDLFLTLG